MDILNSIKYDKLYTTDIKESRFTQGLDEPKPKKYKQNIKIEIEIKEDKPKIYNTLEELVLLNYDYNSLLTDNIKLYLEQIKIKIASEIDENSDKYYDKFKYSKIFKKSLIQQGLQQRDTLTTIIYLSDIYNLSIIIYDKYNNKYYDLSSRKKDIFYVQYFNKKWSIFKTDKSIHFEDSIGGLENMLNCNIKTIDIYEKYLKAISNYKLEDLVKIAKDNNIDLKYCNKKKTKKVLYDEINLMNK